MPLGRPYCVTATALDDGSLGLELVIGMAWHDSAIVGRDHRRSSGPVPPDLATSPIADYEPVADGWHRGGATPPIHHMDEAVGPDEICRGGRCRWSGPQSGCEVAAKCNPARRMPGSRGTGLLRVVWHSLSSLGRKGDQI